MSRRANPALVGAFVVGAVVVAVIGLLLLGGRTAFHAKHAFVLYFDGDVNGLAVGAPVKFQGVQVGSVASIRLRITPEGATTIIPVTILLDENLIASKSGTDFRLEDAALERAIDQGLRARLEMESFVTGQRYVALLQDPASPARLLGLESETDEIPTLPATTEQFVEQLKHVHFDVLVDDLVQTSRAARELLASPEMKALPATVERTLAGIDGVVETLHATAQRTQEVEDELLRTLANAQALLDPDAPLVIELQSTLREFGTAARSLRALADVIEREPEALLRGKHDPDERR